MKLYKLTNQDGQTRGGCQWGENVKHIIERSKRQIVLCTNGVFHAYDDINVALLFNPIHANIKNPLLWTAKGKVVIEGRGKVGCYKLTTIKQISLPAWYKDEEKRTRILVNFAYLCADAAAHAAHVMSKNELSTIAAWSRLTAAYAAHAADAAAHAAHAAHAAAHAADAAAHADKIDFATLAKEAIRKAENKCQ